MASNEVEILVTSKDQTGPGLSAAKEGFRGLEREAGRTAGGFDRVGESADTLDTRAMGFRDSLTGVQDTMLGVGEIARGNLFEGFLTLGMGLGDLGSGIYNFVVPAIKSMSVSLISSAAATVRQTAASGAMAVKSAVVRTATMLWTGAQWLLNAALSANPIGLVVIAVAALIAIIVIAYTRSATFRNIVQGAFRSVLAAGRAMISGLRAAFSFFSTIGGRIRSAFAGAASWLYDAGRAIVRGLINGVKGSIGAAVETVRNMARSAINAAKGALGISSPSKVFHEIGRQIGDGLTGGMDAKQRQAAGSGAALAEAAIPGVGVGRGGPATSGGAMVLRIESGGTRLDDLLVEVLRRAIRTRGGNVQVVLGR